MDNLIIKTKYPFSKKVIYGGGTIIVAVVLLILYLTLEINLLAISVPLLLFGIYILTPLFGSYSTQIITGNGFLTIIWPDRAKINVLESEIERITLSTNYVFIFRKTRKDIKLVLYDKDQKAQVFRFLTEYAKEKSIPLVNQDES